MMHSVNSVRRVPNSGGQIENEGDWEMMTFTFGAARAAGNWSTVWLCQCCLLVLANGECCDSDSHGGDSCEPLSAIESGDHLTMGLLAEEHDSECTQEDRDTGYCNCETESFSSRRCGGCNSWLGGERHAATLWWEGR